jgi:hypothetical protein
MTFPRPPATEAELFPFSYENASLTASLGVSLFKPTRKCRVDAASYINPTGLAAHSSNAFSVALQVPRALVVADFTFTAEADDEIVTAAAHGLQTGDGPVRISNSGGALPTGLAAATDYYVIKIDANTFYLAATRAAALAGTNLTFTTDGTGTHTLSDTASTKRMTTLADGINTDAEDGAALAANVWTDLDIVATSDAILDPAAGDELYIVFTEAGTATLPAGRFRGEARYVV